MSNEGQEWQAGTRLRYHYGIPQDLLDIVLADHRDAQQLRERVRVLEEASVRHPSACKCPWTQHVVDGMVVWARRTGQASNCPQHPLSPVATEGEGA